MPLIGSLDLREASEAGGVSAADTERNKSTAKISVSKFNKPYIHRVHQNLRNINPAAYEPNIIAIGPYHRGKDKMKECKERCLESFLHRNKVTKEAIFSAVAEISSQAMAAYADLEEISSSEFVKMLVMDGCFILELMISDEIPSLEIKTNPILEKKLTMRDVQIDLMLFENQIPFLVLSRIYDVIKVSGPLTDYLLRFFRSLDYQGIYFALWMDRRIYLSLRMDRRDPEDIKHLLDLIHGSLEPWDYRFNQDRNYWKPDNVQFENDEGVQFIGSATDLEEANVRFEKGSDFDNMFEIKFADGILRIPKLKIEDWTEIIFRNFIAYEHHNPARGRNFVTDYALFFRCLIKSPADAKLLQSKGIIDNRLGFHEAVASFANKIMDSALLPKRSEFVYTETFDEINNFYHNRFNRYLGILKRDYFNSPWKITSIVAAVVLLVLTFLSTVFTAIQTFKK